MATYLGSAILNGPFGAKDTPECFLPEEWDGNGVPTEMTLVISAATQEAALRKQVLWHLIRKRIFDLKHEKDPVNLDSRQRGKWRAIALLERMSQEIIPT